MKRSYTYLKGLLTLALAAFTGWMWAADPVATWTDFNTLTSGNYTITKDEACTVNADGSITLGGAGLSYAFKSGDGMYANKFTTVVMDVTLPDATGTLLTLGLATNKIQVNSTGSTLTTSYDKGNVRQTGTCAAGRTTIAVTYSGSQGTHVYKDGVLIIADGSLMWSGQNLAKLTIGAYDDGTIPLTGTILHSMKIYAAKLSAEEVAFPSLAWMVPFNGANTTTGWITSWGGEDGASYVATPNSQGYEVKSGCHPWVDYTLTKPSTVALYADISKVDVSDPGNGAIMIAFGKPGSAGENSGNLVLAKKASDTVVVTRCGNVLASIQDADLALEGSYHLFVFGMNAEGKVFLSIDGTTEESENTTTLPANGLQIGSMFTGVGSYKQGYNMVVDEVRGYNAYLGSEDLAKLVAKFPEYKPQIASVTLEADAAYSTLNLAEGDTVNATITLKDGVTLTMDEAPTCAKLTIVSEVTATVTTSVEAPFANVGNLTLNGNALTVPVQLPATVTMNATTITLEGGTADTPQEVATTIAVASGTTLKTKGYLNFTAENTIASGGTLEVVSGVTTFNAAEQGVKGTLTIDKGATFKNVRETDALAYAINGVVVNVYGTLDMGSTRWTIFANNNTINAYAGATITGAGQSGNGALDIWNKTDDAVAIKVLKNGEDASDVTISATIRYREKSVTFDVAKGMTANLTGTNADVNTILGGLKVKGTGTLKLSGKNAYASDVGVTVESGATLIVAHAEALSTPITNNGTITYTVDATPTNTLSGAGVTGVDAATLNMLSANLDGYTGSFAVANNGTLILPAGEEEGVTVAAGCTLKLDLSVEQLKGPYTTSATIDGGSLIFTKNNGADEITEGVDGGAYTPATAVTYTVATTSWDIAPFAGARVVVDFGDTTEQSVNVKEILGDVTSIALLTVRGTNGGALVSEGVTIPATDIETNVVVENYNAQFGAITIAPDASLKLAGMTSNKSYNVIGKLPEEGQARPKLIVKAANACGLGDDGATSVSNVDFEVAEGSNLFYVRSQKIGANVAMILNGPAALEGTEQTLNLIGLSGSANFVASNSWDQHAFTVNVALPEGAENTYSGILSQGNLAASLTVSGAGKLTLAGANTYTGGTTINNGATLVAASATALGTGNVTNSGTLELNADDVEATIAQVISGTGAVNVKAGTWALTAANGIHANVTVDAGATLDVSAEGATLYTTAEYVSSSVMTVYGTLKTRHWEYGQSLGNLRHNDGALIIDGGTVVMTEDMESARVVQIRNNVTFDIAEGKTFTPTVQIAGDGNLTINGGTLKLKLMDSFVANSNAIVTVNSTLTVDGEAATFFRTVLGEGKIVIPEGAKLAIGEATNHTGETSGLSRFAGTLEIAGTFDPRSWAGNGRKYTIGACNIVMQGGTIAMGHNSDPAAIVIANGKTLSGTGTIAIPVTLADGATLAGAVTVTGDVTVEGALTITHATAADDTVITCANAEAVAAALTGAPEGLKYVAEDGAVKLAVAKKTNFVVTVGDEAVACETIAEALDALAANGGSLQIAADADSEALALTETLTIAADTTIDLNGKTLTSTADPAIHVTGGTLTLTGEGSITAPYVVIKQGTKNAGLTTKVIVGEDVRLTSFRTEGEDYDGDNVVLLYGKATLESAGVLLTYSKGYAAIQGSGGDAGAETAITITGGQVVNSGDDVAIYQPQKGTLTIEGGVISGTTAIYAKAGTISISGGEISGTGAQNAYGENHNGCGSTGDALVVDTTAGYATLSVSITGGAFTSDNAAAVASYAGAGQTAATGIVKADATATFSSDVSDLCEAGYKTEANDEGVYGVVEDPAYGKVAQVGDTYYATLAEAIENATAGQTITLLAGVTINSRLDIAQNVTIDLNGQTIAETMEDQFGAIYVKKGATLTIAATNGGEITTDGGIVIGNYGTVIVDGGTIAAGEDAETDVSIYNFYYQADWYGTTTINGGTVARIWNCGVATLADGEVTDVDNSGAMTITDATVTNIILRDGTDAPGIEGAGTLTAPEGLTVTTLDGQKAVYADGKYTVVKILTLPEELVDSPAAEAIEAAMEAAGVTEISSYTITTKGTADEAATVAAVAAVLEVFEVTPTVDANGVLTVTYEFGISKMTKSGDTITITAGVTGAEYREGVTVGFYADGEEVIGTAITGADSTEVSITADAADLNGKKITVKATK